jgi:hypothetical protein
MPANPQFPTYPLAQYNSDAPSLNVSLEIYKVLGPLREIELLGVVAPIISGALIPMAALQVAKCSSDLLSFFIYIYIYIIRKASLN